MRQPEQIDMIPQRTIMENTQGMIQESNTEQVKYVLNADDVIKSIEHFLRGYSYNKHTGEYIGSPDSALMNDQGVNVILRILKLRLSRVFTLSNYNDKEINITCRVFARNLLKELYAKHKEYGIEKLKIRFIVHEITDCVHATLKKAKHGRYLGFLKDTSRYTETTRLGNQKTILNQLNPMK